MFIKISFYNLSLMFLYLSIIIITFDISPYFNTETDSACFMSRLSLKAIIHISCSILILWGILTFWYLKSCLRSTPDKPITIVNAQKTNEYCLEYLAAYIIPLACFDLSDYKKFIVFMIFYLLIGKIYIRTNLFCTNPTLAFLGYDVYKVTLKNDNSTLEKEILAFSRQEISSLKNEKGRFININNSIYMYYQQKG